MMYTFTPSRPGAVAYAYQGGPLLRLGDVVEMTAEQVARLVSIVEGVNGGPCLIPAQGSAAAEFIAAVSAPTEFNPEDEPSEPTAEPVKRGRGRPKKDPA